MGCKMEMSLRVFEKQHLHSPAWSKTTPGTSVSLQRWGLLRGVYTEPVEVLAMTYHATFRPCGNSLEMANAASNAC